MALPGYVKFLRGTLASYDRLNVKDSNTLYFIYDTEDENRGRLYLGNRLIGSVGGENGIINLADLSDVIASAAQTGDFLVLNSEGKWTATSAASVASIILDAGGTFIDIDTNEFQFNSVNGKLEIKGYAEAAAGTIPVKGVSGIVWQSAPANLESRVGNLETGLSAAQSNISALELGLQNVDGKIANAISNANHLRYQVITDLSQVTETNVIYLYANNSNNSGDQYSEYMLINGSLELLGTLDADLSNYATIAAMEQALSAKADAAALQSLSSTVGTLSSTVSSLSTDLSGLTSRVVVLENASNNYVLTSTFNATIGNLNQINGIKNNLSVDASITDNLIDIYERLTWHELSE